MLVSPGRNVRHSDMQLLEGVKMSTTGSSGGWAIQGSWDPREAAFAVLNQETGPDIQSVYMTVAADLVINQVASSKPDLVVSGFKVQTLHVSLFRLLSLSGLSWRPRRGSSPPVRDSGTTAGGVP